MKKLKKAVEEFNRLRGSEPQAEIIEAKDDEAVIEFKAPSARLTDCLIISRTSNGRL